jgi:hypothetical protein
VKGEYLTVTADGKPGIEMGSSTADHTCIIPLDSVEDIDGVARLVQGEIKLGQALGRMLEALEIAGATVGTALARDCALLKKRVPELQVPTCLPPATLKRGELVNTYMTHELKQTKHGLVAKKQSRRAAPLALPEDDGGGSSALVPAAGGGSSSSALALVPVPVEEEKLATTLESQINARPGFPGPCC